MLTPVVPCTRSSVCGIASVERVGAEGKLPCDVSVEPVEPVEGTDGTFGSLGWLEPDLLFGNTGLRLS